MAIIAASIEANGWVLRLRVSGTPGSFASYALDPDGMPRVSLAVSHPGFVPSGGIAVPGALARTLVATKPLRKPVNPASPTTPVIDETDNGDGSVTVRLALSNYVHATETGVTLAVLAGWRGGEPAGSGIAVGNGSTFAAALPIFRWADVSYNRVTGAFALELLVFSHYPQGLLPVAGVRFTATDGSGVKTVWATSLSTSTKYGDSVRVYTATIDPAAATALNAGLLRCDAEVYPWLGSMRSTDPAGTRSMTGLATAGYGTSAQSPLVVGHDPAGTRYAGQFCFVDPVNGTSTASAAMVQPSLAAAKSVAPASRPAGISTALQALYLFNRSLPAANGGATAGRATDGARIVLAAGTHPGPGTTAVTSGITSSELPVIVEGDPDAADPRTACILQTGAAAGSSRVTKMLFRNLALEIGGAALFGSTLTYVAFDNVEIRGKAGQESSGTAPLVAAAPANRYNLTATRTRWWRSGVGFQGATLRFGLLRACEWSRVAEAQAIVGGRFLPSGEDTTVGAAVLNGTGVWSAADLGSVEDAVVAGVDIRGLRGRVWSPGYATAALAGTPNPSVRRNVFANNLCERIGTDPQPFWSMGEDGSATMSYNIVEANSFVGERCNMMYSDPLPVTVADTDNQLNQAFGNRIANNSFDWAATKHDAFDDSTTRSVRVAGGVANPTGYRPQMVETWSITYGVGFEGNYDWGRHPSAGNFRFEYFGLRGVQATGGAPAWPADRSTYGSPATGGGSYKPPAGSPLIGRGFSASIDRDRTGAVRSVPFATGAVDTASAAPVALTPASGVLASLAASALVVWGATLAPAPAVLITTGAEPAVALTGLTLLPASGGISLGDIGAAVLPDLLFKTPRLVRIEGEVTVQLIERD